MGMKAWEVVIKLKLGGQEVVLVFTTPSFRCLLSQA